MSSSNTQTLVVIGSGPGIGVSTASLFASKKFNNVALLSRDSARLATDRQRILDAAKEANRNVDVELWTTDITDSASLQSTLTTVQERMPNITCVLFNAARVAPSELLAHDENEMILDFKVGGCCQIETSKRTQQLMILRRSRILGFTPRSSGQFRFLKNFQRNQTPRFS
jgi:NAD(P)-dependent dehydrogenase (short-subunit alcohol dehydrogenase family)